MSLPNPDAFGDYLVFVDESGDHGLAAVNRDFPLFALAFCVFPKAAYVDEVTPALRRLKLATFGHRETKGHRVVPVALRRTGSPIPKPRFLYPMTQTQTRPILK